MRRRAVAGALGAGVAVVAAAIGAGLTTDRWASWWSGEADVWGNRAYVPAYDVSDAEFAKVDLARVHSELLPEWELQARRGRGAAAFRPLGHALAADPNLRAIARELRDRVHDDAFAHADRILYLTWAWNEYLDLRRQPWRLDAVVIANGDDSVFYTKSYRVLHDLRGRVGASTHRVRLTQRADHLGVVESYLGHTTHFDEGALIVVDRTRDFTLDRVWPLLADGPPLDGVSEAFAPAVRDAVAAALSTDHVAVLGQTAPLRRELLAQLEHIHERNACGSTLQIRPLPPSGVDTKTRQDLLAYARNSIGRHCPAVTESEVEHLGTASDALAAVPSLDDALGALLALVARGVTIHELRHVADAPTPDSVVPCPGCDAELGRGATYELSAYLASFSDAETGVVSLLQACDVETDDGPHGSAMAAIRATLQPGGCAAGPAPDLGTRARDLEQRMFGRSDVITVPEDFPTTLPVR